MADTPTSPVAEVLERAAILVEPFAREAGSWLVAAPDSTPVLTMGPSDDGPGVSEFTLGDLRRLARLLPELRQAAAKARASEGEASQ